MNLDGVFRQQKLHTIFWGHFVKLEVIVLGQGIFLRERSSLREIPKQQNNDWRFHTMTQTKMVQNYYCH